MVGARPFRVEALGFEFSYRRSFAAAVCRDLFGFALNALGRKQRQFQQLGRGGVLVLKSLAVAGGMVHYLAFDFFVGSWEARDALAHQIPHLAVVPCLLLTFLFGPAGLLLYLLLRFTLRRQIQL